VRPHLCNGEFAQAMIVASNGWQSRNSHPEIFFDHSTFGRGRSPQAENNVLPAVDFIVALPCDGYRDALTPRPAQQRSCKIVLDASLRIDWAHNLRLQVGILEMRTTVVVRDFIHSTLSIPRAQYKINEFLSLKDVPHQCHQSKLQYANTKYQPGPALPASTGIQKTPIHPTVKP
jgi:hypothetical protein